MANFIIPSQLLWRDKKVCQNRISLPRKSSIYVLGAYIGLFLVRPAWAHYQKLGITFRSFQGYRFARYKAYKWLSDNMMVPLDKTYIGMFGIEECRKDIDICIKCI